MGLNPNERYTTDVQDELSPALYIRSGGGCDLAALKIGANPYTAKPSNELDSQQPPIASSEQALVDGSSHGVFYGDGFVVLRTCPPPISISRRIT